MFVTNHDSIEQLERFIQRALPSPKYKQCMIIQTPQKELSRPHSLIMPGFKHMVQNTLLEIEGNVFILPNGNLIIFTAEDPKTILSKLTSLVVKVANLEKSELELSLLDLSKGPGDLLSYFKKEKAAISQIKQEGLAPTPDISEYNSNLAQTVFARRKIKRKFAEILVIDDKPEVSEELDKTFGSLARVRWADNAISGIDHYLVNLPDIVFLSINLGDNSGFNVLKTIQTIDHKSAYVVMTSYDSTSENIEKAKKMGAKTFITKPINSDRAVELFKGALKFQKTFKT